MLREDLTLFNLEGARPGDQWGYSSAGRAPALQAGGQRFDPVYLHHPLFLERKSGQKELCAGLVSFRCCGTTSPATRQFFESFS